MNRQWPRNMSNFAIAMVWLINGLFCKLLGFAPRHQAIVARILGEGHAFLFTKAIGVSELLVCAWVISGIRPKLCAVFQAIIVLSMNAIEFFAAPDLLMFGRLNALVALVFTGFVLINGFAYTHINRIRTGT